MLMPKVNGTKGNIEYKLARVNTESKYKKENEPDTTMFGEPVHTLQSATSGWRDW